MRVLLFILLCLPVFGASPATCTAVADMLTAGQFNTPGNWTCTADGGTSVPYRGVTMTISAGVPGAAGKKDRIRTNGHIVHTGGALIQIGDVTASEPSQGLIVDGSGSFVVDAGDYAELDGYNSAAGLGGLAQIIRNGQFTVVPAGWLALNAAFNTASEFENRGRLNIGSALSGAWVEAVVATGSFRAWTGGTGIYAQFNGQTLPTVAIGDLVILEPIPIPATTGSGLIGPPYSLFNSTIPVAAQPIGTMPVTSDPTTCGARADCLIPQGQLLCVTGVTPLTLGFPTSGQMTSAVSCAGSVPFTITSTGRSPLWLKKPAIISNITQPGWNVSNTLTSSVINPAKYDALYSRFAITAPISSAAGTGPGRPGDTSLSITAIDITTAAGTHCTVLRARSNRESDMTQCGDWWADENLGEVGFWGSHNSLTISATWKSRSTTINIGNPIITSNAAGVTGNELNIQNSLVLDLYGYSGGNAVIVAKSFDNSLSNGGFSFDRNTVIGGNLIDTYALVGSASIPVSFSGNAIYKPAASGPLNGLVRTFTGSSYLSFTGSLFHTQDAPIVTAGNFTVNTDNPHFVLAGNVGVPQDAVTFAPAYGDRNTYSDAIVQRNRFESSRFAGWTVFIGISGTLGHPAVHEWNYLYASYIGWQYGKYTTIVHNLMAWNPHHSMVQTWNDGALTPTYTPGLAMHHNINLEAFSTCAETGYETYVWLDAPSVYNNTCLGATFGGFSIGDQGGDNSGGGDAPSVSMLTGAQFKNNISYTDVSNPTSGAAWGFEIGTNSGGNLINYQCAVCGANAIYGAKQANYYHTPTWPPNQELHTFNRFTKFVGLTNVTGVALQNPTYTSLSGATVAFTHTSASNMTLSLNDGGGAGAAAQLNYSGAGTTWTGGAVTDVTVSGYGTIAITGAGGTGDFTVGCPQGNYLIDTTASLTFGVMRCPDANTLTVVPGPFAAGARSGDSYVLIKSQVRLNNSGATNYVDAGVDPRLLLVTSQSDASVSLALTDFCSSGCLSSLSLGLPGGTGAGTDYTNDVTNAPIIPMLSPSQGGDMVCAFGCIGSPYLPVGSAWLTAALDGGNIGAVNVPNPSLLLSGPAYAVTTHPATIVISPPMTGDTWPLSNYVVSPSVSGCSGSFSPSTVTLTGGSGPLTMTFTPTTIGTCSITMGSLPAGWVAPSITIPSLGAVPTSAFIP